MFEGQISCLQSDREHRGDAASLQATVWRDFARRDAGDRDSRQDGRKRERERESRERGKRSGFNEALMNGIHSPRSRRS